MREYSFTFIVDDPMADAWHVHDFCLGAECGALVGKLGDRKRIAVSPNDKARRR